MPVDFCAMLNVQQQESQVLHNIVGSVRTDIEKLLNQFHVTMRKQREESRKQLEQLFDKIHASNLQSPSTNVDADSNVEMTTRTTKDMK
eukprot:scaffold271729_cov20-Prasinocladus_malaysianus.AAC.1